MSKRVRGTDVIKAPPVYVSECDLTLDDEDLKDCLDTLGLDEFLYQCWGFDKNHYIKGNDKFYEIDDVEHRSRRGKIVRGKRYVGVERLDDEWLDSPMVSQEAKDIARQDLSYLKEISNLSKRLKSS